LAKQLSNCPNTERLFLVGSHYGLNYRDILTGKGKVTAKIQGIKDGSAIVGRK
jgi:hypothetical protein|tara:strand:- start:273 stop:431 length:159 start_codon:yes stop_codon:yes gene_type:complete